MAQAAVKRRRIFLLITTPKKDGPGKVFLNVVKNLDLRKYDVYAGFLYGRGELEEELRPYVKGLFNARQRGPLNGWLDAFAAGRLRAYLKDNGIELVNSHLVRANIFGWLAGRRLGVPVVPTVQNLEYHYQPRNPVERLIRRLEGLVFRDAPSVICSSYHLKTNLEKIYSLPGNKVRVVWNGTEDIIYPRRGEAGLRAELGLAGRLVFGIIARLDPQKDIAVLLRAVNLLKGSGALAQMRFLIVGSGSQEAELKAYVERNGLNDAVTFLGYRTDLFNIYNSLDVFVLTSRWEGFAMALVEAASAALPIIASDIGDHRSLITAGWNGYLFPPGDERALAGLIAQMAAADRPKLGRASRQVFLDKFLAAHMAGRYQAVYGEVLGD